MTKNSYITITDQFCGAGGSSIGASATGAEIVLAMNHWKLAIETHNTNFPNTRHECTDISACDPRRYPDTDILITSPECTNHSIAKGRKRAYYQKDIFGNVLIDPAEERSRATMWDVPRFAEEHTYNIIIVENVVDARHWVMWDAWLHAMQCLGYKWKCVFFNSQFAHPTPQSRDRMYVIFWREGNREPDLDFRPPAWCEPCGVAIEARQSWKQASKAFGRYGKNGQYIYTCPLCHSEVRPYYYPALTAIDWSLPIQRIGDRDKPLKERTLERIRLGLGRFGSQYLLIDEAYVGANGNYTRPVTDAMRTQTARQSLALLGVPWLQPMTRDDEARAIYEAGRTQTGTETQALVMPRPFLVEEHGTSNVRPLDGPLGTVMAGGNHHYLALPFLIRSFGVPTDAPAKPVTEPTGAVTAIDHHSLIMPFLTSYYGSGGEHPVTDASPTQVGNDRHALVMPFIASQYTGPSRNAVQAVDEALPTVPGMAVHYIAQPGEIPSVEDCGFRMLEPHEIQAAMAFPGAYVVKGNKRERVKQLGNAVTPPVMEMLIRRCIASLEVA